ncbi:MAG: hypothetical protein JWR02_2271, partial [Mucilaginibacter sp.]|nr:hypothetical protein [Mucilaginibacter sp.]
YLRKTPFIVSKIKLRRTISVGEKSRVPFGTDGLMDAMGANVQSIVQKAVRVGIPKS